MPRRILNIQKLGFEEFNVPDVCVFKYKNDYVAIDNDFEVSGYLLNLDAHDPEFNLINKSFIDFPFELADSPEYRILDKIC
tara:strand:+ start:360 stop:602 length:243 start_codon:yes stop_codon:yes gene_type:complete